MEKTRLWSLALSIAVVLATSITFALTTFATKAELKDFKENLADMKKEVKDDVEQKHEQVQKNLDDVKAVLKTVDSRLWQVLKEVKKTN